MRLAALALLVACTTGTAFAADKKQSLPEVPAKLTPQEADAFLSQLTDAQARALLAHELHAKAERKAAAPAPREEGLGSSLMRLVEDLQSTEARTGNRKQVAVQGFAALPGALSTGTAEVFGPSPAARLVLLALILAAAWMAARLARRALEPYAREHATPVVAALVRFLLDIVPLAAFAAVSLALALAISEGGTPARMLYAAYAAGAILIAALAVVLRLVLAPASAPLRPLPLSDDAARFLYRWLLAVWAVAVLGSLTTELVMPAGAPRQAHAALALSGGSAVVLVLIAMALAARRVVPASSLPPLLARAWPALAIVYVLMVWGFWAGALLDGHPSRVVAAAASLGIVLAFPLLDYWVGRALEDVLGSPGGEVARRGVAGPLRWAMRLLIAVLLITGANELWGFERFEWQAHLRRALLDASFDLVAAFAVAVLGWQFIKLAIDRQLQPREVDGVRVEPNQRMRTLLPLARVFLVTALIVTTVMLVLSGIGVNIGPLLAGAGIVGLAIGFGAQTLVRDIITGVFLILDDAFRVGEYILSGNYKGTVESIGLRSVKLRHHRGPIYVVPFGELRGVQNVSRDWVIHKFTIGITYDSDLEKARKLVKKIGQGLAEDPEYKDTLLEPLKMQGVEKFGDFAVEVRMKMMTRPGDKQFALRRKAQALIKKSFDENGIKFAFPTVQIAGGGDAAAAAAATRVPGIAGDQAA